MKTVIMAGGLGTRLRPLTCLLPKPMVPVVNRPILEHIITLLKKHAITDLILLLYYLPDKIKDYFGDGAKFGVKIQYITAGEDFGTAGAVKQAANFIDDSFLVISGDAMTDLDLTRFIEFHKKQHGLATIALSRVGNPSPFGIAITDKEYRINRFLEKPSWSQIFSDTVNMGIYMLQPEIFDFIPKDKELYFAKDLFPELLKDGQALFGFISDCYWKDIGGLRTYQQVHWDAFNALFAMGTEEQNEEALIKGKNCKLSRRVKFEGRVILGDDCQIAEGVFLRNVVIGKNCRVGTNTSMVNCILWDRVEVGRGCELSQAVIATGAKVGSDCFVSENVFISQRSHIGSGCRINSNVKIWPEKQVDDGSVVNSNLVWGEKWQRELFTDSRVTGLANYEITPEFGAKLGAAFGTWLSKGSTVLLSRDATPAARMIYRSIITGLMSAGVNVQSVQVMPVPIVRYTLRSSLEKGGVHVRRSPFENKLLDILFFDRNGRDFSASTAKAFERVFFREDFPRVPFDEVGTIEYPVRIAESYVQDFLDKVDSTAIGEKKFKIVIDYSFGAATQVFPTILGALDCEVISLDAYLDPEKLTRTAGAFEEDLKQLARIVKSTQADIGFLIDAGAEKIFCVDEKGRIIASERLAVLVSALYFRASQPQKITVPVAIPMQVEKFAQERNIELVHTANDGGSIIKSTEDPEVNYALGTRGGFIFTEFHFAFDGMFSLVKLLELMAKTGISLGKLNDEIPRRVYVSDEVSSQWESKGKIMRRMTEFSEGKDRLLVDGVKLLLDDAWVLVLPDQDKPLCHVIAEAEKEGRARKLVAEFKERVKEWSK